MHLLHLLTRNATTRLLLALGAAALLYLALYGKAWDTRLVVAWDGFMGVLLAVSATTFSITKPADIRKVATGEDSSRFVIFLVIVAGGLVSLFAILFLLHRHPGAAGLHLPVSVLAVALSWALVHASFCFRYAHAYYDDHAEKPGQLAGGIDFPGEEGSEPEPDYWDFAYFAYVIGMTAQVSDTGITSRHIRRLALAHGLISFVYNTVIIALSISVVSGIF